MRIALPHYLAGHLAGSRLDACPPGHRFSLYFDGWEQDWKKPANKTPAFRQIADAFPEHSSKALDALCGRQQAASAGLGTDVLSYPVRLTAPLATGLGNEHPLENGFAFLNPYGLPYLAGSGVKGVLRRAAEELASGAWGETSGWTRAAADILFGLETEAGDIDTARTRGALVFWDLFFAPPKGKGALVVEIMTPHHSRYLQEDGTPHANDPPNPIPFLAVPAGSECTFYIQCNPALVPHEHALLRDAWRALIKEALVHAGEWLGFGAKTAVGYGRLYQDEQTARAAANRAHEASKAAELEQRKRDLEKLTPEARAISEFIDACIQKAQAGHKDRLNAGLHQRAGELVAVALKPGAEWSPDDRAALADALETWLPRVVEKLSKKDDWKDARKKLRIAQLRPQS